MQKAERYLYNVKVNISRKLPLMQFNLLGSYIVLAACASTDNDDTDNSQPPPSGEAALIAYDILDDGGVGDWASAAALDADNDGDNDLLIGNGGTDLIYYRNNNDGTWTQLTGSNNPFNDVTTNGTRNTPVFADIDDDGDDDLLIGTLNEGFVYYNNDGGIWVLQSDADNPFAGIGTDDDSEISDVVATFGDSDGDDNLDMLYGTVLGNIGHYERINGAWEAVTDSPFADIDVGLYSSPALGDIDGDGDDDLLIGNDFGEIAYYQNNGDGTWSVQSDENNPFATFNSGAPIRLNFGNIDNDNTLDLIIGSEDGTFTFFYNQGDGVWTQSNSETDNIFADIADVGENSAPILEDLDGDGDADLLIGARDGTVHYYENRGNDGWVLHDLFNDINFGEASVPFIYDIDGDKDMDFLIGTADGYIRYYANEPDGIVEKTGSDNPFASINLGENSIPRLADIDGDGDADLIGGESSGTLYYYENENNEFTRRANEGNPFNGIDVGDNSAPIFIDLDGDTYLELIIGAEDGTLYYYEHDSDGTWRERSGSDNPFNGLEIGDNAVPALADLNDDRVFDLIIGGADGLLVYYGIELL